MQTRLLLSWRQETGIERAHRDHGRRRPDPTPACTNRTTGTPVADAVNRAAASSETAHVYLS
jgi:hypothetical protein